MKVKLDVKLFNEENTRRSQCHGVCVMRSDAKCVCNPVRIVIMGVVVLMMVHVQVINVLIVAVNQKLEDVVVMVYAIKEVIAYVKKVGCQDRVILHLLNTKRVK